MDCEENRLTLLHQKMALPLPLHAQRGSNETVSSTLIPCITSAMALVSFVMSSPMDPGRWSYIPVKVLGHLLNVNSSG